MSNTLLEAKNLSIAFNTANPCVKQISFKIAKGEILALVGESGSGKTLTALSINQLLPPGAAVHQDSQIVWQGKHDLLTLPRKTLQQHRGKHIGMIFQDALVALNPVLTIGAQMTEVLLRHHICKTSTQAEERCQHLLSEVGLKNPLRCMHSYPHELSGGMVQRAHIAIAIAAEPDLLIADEPTTALDQALQHQIIALLRKLQAGHEMSLLFITHDLRLVEHCADRVIVMQSGQIVEQQGAKAFFKSPRHAYSKQLIKAATPKPRPDLAKPNKPRIKPLLQVDNLNVEFKLKKAARTQDSPMLHVLNDVSLNIYPGKTLAIIGESGSGKTTTARVILDLVNPSSGKLKFADKSMNGRSRRARAIRRRNIQAIFQNPCAAMNPRLSIMQTITEGLWAQNRISSKQQAAEQATQLLEAVELDADCLQRYPHEFSGGQRQRICIARALAMQPKLLICDEPTSALDVSIQAQILGLLKKIQKAQGIAYLLITHDKTVVSHLADHVLQMVNGQLQPWQPEK